MSFGSMRQLFPISQNLLRVPYLLESAALTRIITGSVRVKENLPSKNTKNNTTAQERYSSFWERIFIEIIGTIGYVLAIPVGQDLIAHLQQKRASLQPEALLKRLKSVLSAEEHVQISQAIEQIFDGSYRHLIAKRLDGRATLATLKTKLASAGELAQSTVQKALPELEPYFSRLNRSACLTVVGGIGFAALVGGIGFQWVNDRIFAPYIEPVLNQLAGIGYTARRAHITSSGPDFSKRKPPQELTPSDRTFIG